MAPTSKLLYPFVCHASANFNSAWFNNVTYVRPKVPTLYTALTSSSYATNPAIYGDNTHSIVLERGQVVEIILNNDDPGKHPFHLHGHAFQAVVRSDEEAGFYAYNETFPETPMRRDTLMVRPSGYMVLRFRADNPGRRSPLSYYSLLLLPANSCIS